MASDAKGSARAPTAAETAVISREPVHAGWRGVGAFQDVYSVLEAMGHLKVGHLKALQDNAYTFLTSPIPDAELYRLCSAPFKRNLKGAPMHRSQYGLEFTEFSHHYTPDVVEAMGTARARDLMQRQMASEMEKLAQTHPVAVWRTYPEIETSQGRLCGYLRMYVMTEAQYQHFAQIAD